MILFESILCCVVGSHVQHSRSLIDARKAAQKRRDSLFFVLHYMFTFYNKCVTSILIKVFFYNLLSLSPLFYSRLCNNSCHFIISCAIVRGTMYPSRFPFPRPTRRAGEWFCIALMEMIPSMFCIYYCSIYCIEIVEFNILIYVFFSTFLPEDQRNLGAEG